MKDSITLKGIMGKQRGRKFIVGLVTAKEIIELHEIDKWEAGKSIEEQGCQRPPIKSHYRKIGRKLKNDRNATLPTSITLSANLHTKSEENKGSIKIKPITHDGFVNVEIPNGHKLKIIDGQHRILGLEYLIYDLLKNDDSRKSEMLNFQLPFVIILTESRVDEINLFYEINSTPKRVPTDLALQLLNEININSEINLSKTEKWKLVALNIAMVLNKDEESVWYQNISEGQNTGQIASSTSFVTSLKPILEIEDIKRLWENNADEKDAGKKIAALLKNYWNALKKLMPLAFPDSDLDKELWVIQKTPGFYTWHLVAPFILDDCLKKREKTLTWTTDNIYKFLKKYGAFGISDYETVWKASNKAMGEEGGFASKSNSQKAFKELSENIIDEIDESYSENYDDQVSF